jgi:hypothetical protein
MRASPAYRLEISGAMAGRPARKKLTIDQSQQKVVFVDE